MMVFTGWHTERNADPRVLDAQTKESFGPLQTGKNRYTYPLTPKLPFQRGCCIGGRIYGGRLVGTAMP